MNYVLNQMKDQVSGDIVSMLASSAEGRGFIPIQVIPKTLKLVFVASPLSREHLVVRAHLYFRSDHRATDA